MTEVIECQIAKLSPKKGDLIVIKVDALLTRDQLHRITQQYVPYFEEVGCKVVVLGREVDLQVVEQVPGRQVLQLPNSGHGHVFPRDDGVLARCGGPGICADCKADQLRKLSEGSS